VSAVPAWRRELPEGVTVAVDGVVEEAADPVPARRSVAWVVVRMPDYVADTVAHLLASGAEVLAEQLTGPDERALAEALYVASQVSGYHCPGGGLGLPEVGGG
jgi:hypothetical protein